MTYDAIIVGGSFAGLAAALYLGRARRKVAVLDTGLPRNRFAAESHGLLTRDGEPPLDILARAREQVLAYPTIEIIEGAAASARGEMDRFAVGLRSGETLDARRLILAFGVSDRLPDVPGLLERWGRSVIHCPYCHGYEFAEQRLGVLASHPMSTHQAMLIAEWGPTTFFLNGRDEPDAATLVELTRRGVAIERAPVARLSGDGTALAEVELSDGRRAPIDALYVASDTAPSSPIAAELGCRLSDTPFGPDRMVAVDGFAQTSVAGVLAAGDITRGGHSVTWAMSDGVMAGTALHRSLVFPDA